MSAPEQIELLSPDDDVRTSPAGLERAPYPTDEGNALADMLGAGLLCCCEPDPVHAQWCGRLPAVPTCE